MNTLVDLDTKFLHRYHSWVAARNVSPLRQRADQTRAERYLLPYFKERSVTRITVTDIESWVQTLLQEGVGAATIYACLSILRQVFDSAVDSGIHLPENPARAVGVPGADRVSPITPDDIIPEDVFQRILAATDPRYSALVLFAARTGARWDECLGQQAGDFYLAEGHVVIGRYRVVEKSGKFDEIAGSPRDSRLIEMTMDLVAAMQKHLSDSKSWRRPGWDWAFLTPRDHRHILRPNFIAHVWRPALMAVGLSPNRYTFYNLRHTAVANMILYEGWDIDQVAAALGTRSHATLRRTYDAFFTESARRNAGPGRS